MPDCPPSPPPSPFHWSLFGEDLQIRGLSLTLSDDPLCVACGAFAQRVRLNPQLDPNTAASSFVAALQPEAWDTLYKLLRLAGPLTWSDVRGTQTNIATGQPVSRGKIDSAGNFVPPAPDDAIAGFGLPSPAIKLGKQFLFATDPDVHLYLYVDKDAYANDMKDFVSGGGIEFGGKTSGGTPLKLRLAVGRDEAGGGAGFLQLQIGPDAGPPRKP